MHAREYSLTYQVFRNTEEFPLTEGFSRLVSTSGDTPFRCCKKQRGNKERTKQFGVHRLLAWKLPNNLSVNLVETEISRRKDDGKIKRMRRSSVGSASACCKAGPSSSLVSASHGGSPC